MTNHNIDRQTNSQSNWTRKLTHKLNHQHPKSLQIGISSFSHIDRKLVPGNKDQKSPYPSQQSVNQSKLNKPTNHKGITKIPSETTNQQNNKSKKRYQPPYRKREIVSKHLSNAPEEQLPQRTQKALSHIKHKVYNKNKQKDI